MAFWRHPAAILASVCVMVSSPALYADPSEDIKALVDRGDAAAAYQFGKSHPDELGTPSFDFYFGIGAIDSGHAGEGVLALERYTVNHPENLSARLELARGYFVMGDDQRAREEFNQVLETNPPAPVKANVERFLTAMHSRESDYRMTVGGFVEAAYGYDTNANGGVGNSNINLPGFGDVTVSDNGVRVETPYQWLAAGGRIAKPLAPGLTAIADGRVDSRFHGAAQQFDQRNASATAGFTYLKNKNFYRAAASYSQLTVDDARFRHIGDVSVEWLRQLNEFGVIQTLAQYGRLRYAAANGARDADLTAAGLGFRKAFIARWQPQASFNAHAGRERNVQSRPDLGRHLLGASAGLTVAPAAKWTLATAASYQRSHYDSEDPLTLVLRQDHNYGINAVANYSYTRHLILGLELQLARNDSNLELYDYERGIVTFKIRYEFR